MATNYTGAVKEQITTLRTVPLNTTRTGTIKTIGKDVIGAGTTFGVDLKVGDWITDLTQSEIRKVVSISNSTNAYIDHPFTVDLPALTVLSVVSRNNVSVISFNNVGAATALLNGSILNIGESGNFGKFPISKGGSTDFVAPIIIDATGTTVSTSYLI